MSTNAAGLVAVPSSILDRALGYVEVSSLTVKRALDEVAVHRAAREKAARLTAPLLAKMVENGNIAASQKKEAEAMLGSHDLTLALLDAAVEKIAELKKQAAAGRADPGEGVAAVDSGLGGGPRPRAEKAASADEYNSLEDPVVGRRTPYLKESDKALMAAAQHYHR